MATLEKSLRTLNSKFVYKIRTTTKTILTLSYLKLQILPFFTSFVGGKRKNSDDCTFMVLSMLLDGVWKALDRLKSFFFFGAPEGRADVDIGALELPDVES